MTDKPNFLGIRSYVDGDENKELVRITSNQTEIILRKGLVITEDAKIVLHDGKLCIHSGGFRHIDSNTAYVWTYPWPSSPVEIDLKDGNLYERKNQSPEM